MEPVHSMKWSLAVFDIDSIKDPKKLVQDLYAKLCKIKAELEKRIETSDFYYPTQETLLDRRELDAISTLVKYIENFGKE